MHFSAIELNKLNKSIYVESGWKPISKGEREILIPRWDTDDSNNNLNLIRQSVLKKCACKKSRCLTNNCGCKKNGNHCSNLCTCNDCSNRVGEENVESNEKEEHDEEEEEVELEEEWDEEEEEEDEEEDDEEEGYDTADEISSSDDNELQEIMDSLCENNSEDEEAEEEFVYYLLA